MKLLETESLVKKCPILVEARAKNTYMSMTTCVGCECHAGIDDVSGMVKCAYVEGK